MASYVLSFFYAHSGLVERVTRQKPMKIGFRGWKESEQRLISARGGVANLIHFMGEKSGRSLGRVNEH
jgi:hypothetical protein